jgi:hypothetical protein
MKDSLGVDILLDDTVLVISYGEGARQVDCGTRSSIVKLGRTRATIFDSDREFRAVSSRNLAVVRRDGATGLEGNVTR